MRMRGGWITWCKPSEPASRHHRGSVTITRLPWDLNAISTSGGCCLASIAGNAAGQTNSNSVIGRTRCSPECSVVSSVGLMTPPNAKPRRVLFTVTLATVAIFGGLVALLTFRLREQLRDQVLRREAEAIHAVALMQLGREEERLSEFAPEFALDDMFAAVLESSKLRGVLAVQLYDAQGVLRQSSTPAPEDAENSKWWPNRLPVPRARFIADGTLDMAAPMEAIRSGAAAAQLPLLDIAVPLRTEDFVAARRAVARYWIHGAGVAAEFARMDRGLALQAGIVFVGGA